MSKGTKNERRAHKILQRAGYIAYRPATVRFGENDVFGLFDVLAMYPDTGHEKWVQVKSNDSGSKGSWFSKVHLFDSPGRDIELWNRYDREGWKVDRYDTDGSDDGRINGPYKTIYDERKDPSVSTHRGTPLSIGEGLTQFLKGGLREVSEAGGNDE